MRFLGRAISPKAIGIAGAAAGAFAVTVIGAIVGKARAEEARRAQARRRAEAEADEYYWWQREQRRRRERDSQ